MDRRDFLIVTGMAATAELLALQSASGRDDGATAVVVAAAAGAPAGKGISLERRLADYALAVKYENLPGEIVAMTKRLLLDTLACGFGAVGSAPAKIAERAFRKTFGGQGAASILGGAQPISAEGAALVNGVLVRYLDFNDIYVGTDPLHPSEVIPAAIAVCEEAGRNGRDLIETIVVGYEAEMRINDGVSLWKRGFHPLSAAAYATPLMAGKAWNMPSEQIAHAVGISGTRGLTLFVVNSGAISMMKALGHAHSAMDGLFATRLAAEGFTGPAGTIDWVAAKIEPVQASLNIDLDERHYRLPKVGLKRFPLQFELQAVVEAGVNLYPSVKGRAGAVHEIVVETYPGIIQRVADPGKYKPTTRETADHSLPICLAMALLDGDVSGKQFHDDRWRAREVFALAEKITVKPGEALIAKMPKGRGSSVAIRFNDNQLVSHTVEIPDGDAARPLSRPALEHKYLSLAGPVLGDAGAKRVMTLVDRLEEIEDVRTFTAALRGAA